jgi:hypothetical protein
VTAVKPFDWVVSDKHGVGQVHYGLGGGHVRVAFAEEETVVPVRELRIPTAQETAAARRLRPGV